MARRVRLVRKEDGTVESRTSKYNGKYLFGNLFMCGDCGAPYREELKEVRWFGVCNRDRKRKRSMHQFSYFE